MSIRRISLIALLVTLAFSSVLYASGHWQCNQYDQCVWVDDDPQPVYYETLPWYPDWCLYTPGDRVYVHYAFAGTTIWEDYVYVIPGNDYVSTGPTGPGWSPDWYVSSTCSIFSVP